MKLHFYVFRGEPVEWTFTHDKRGFRWEESYYDDMRHWDDVDTYENLSHLNGHIKERTGATCLGQLISAIIMDYMSPGTYQDICDAVDAFKSLNRRYERLPKRMENYKSWDYFFVAKNRIM